ncbi:MAG TPA: tetratricopeptide repeat protein, partial [Candidatus Marinimicrobia bacterium]|nr:tetratricopeptide repeat protein [Candidatus Neomarinimicrobiota bacterium]
MIIRHNLKLLILCAIFLLTGCADKPPVIPEDLELVKREVLALEPKENPQAIAHFMDGQLFMFQGNYSMAILEFQDAMVLDPRAIGITVSMAECYWKLGKVDKSEDLLLKAIKLEPDDIEAREMLANQYIYRNQQNKAIEQFSILVDLTPKGDAKYIIALGKLTLAENKINEAIAYFIKAYETDPNRIDILEEAANLSLRSRQLDQARDLYKKLINIDKNNAYYLSTYIDLIVMRGDYDNGVIALESLVDLEGETTERLSQLGILYYKLGNSLKAKPLFEKLVEMGDTDATVLHFLSSIYLEQNKLDSAIVIAYRLMDHFPSDPRGYLDAAMVELNRENPSGAIDILNPVSEKFQKEFSIQYLLGSSYQQLEEYDKATKLLRRSLTIYPDSRGARHTLAIASDAMQHWSESDSLYEGLIASDTNDVQALNNYSYSLVERNIQLKKSLVMSKKAIDMEPDNAAYLDTIGWIYYKLNNAQKALYYIRRSIELEDENAVVLEHLGD